MRRAIARTNNIRQKKIEFDYAYLLLIGKKKRRLQRSGEISELVRFREGECWTRDVITKVSHRITRVNWQFYRLQNDLFKLTPNIWLSNRMEFSLLRDIALTLCVSSALQISISETIYYLNKKMDVYPNIFLNYYLMVFCFCFSISLRCIGELKEVRGVIVTAKGDDVDFVSRFFAPQSGIPEDPVTGSAYTTLTPFWSSKLKKKQLSALQLSSRRGYLTCENLGARIEISGRAKTFLEGKIFVS